VVGEGVLVVAGGDAAPLLIRPMPRSVVLRCLYTSGSNPGGLPPADPLPGTVVDLLPGCNFAGHLSWIGPRPLSTNTARPR
jgi:hypothetical protein